MKPQVSVVVPVRNSAPYAARCVACLKAQTLREVEFFIVDDASTDSTVVDLEREIAGDARFQRMRRPGPGCPANGQGAFLRRQVHRRGVLHARRRFSRVRLRQSVEEINATLP